MSDKERDFNRLEAARLFAEIVASGLEMGFYIAAMVVIAVMVLR